MYLSSGRAAEVAGPQLLRDADRLLAQAAEASPRSPERERVLRLVGLLYLARELGLRQGAVLPEASHIAGALGLLHDTRPQLLPAPLWDLAVEFGADPATRAETAASFAQAEKDGGADPLAFLVALEHAVADLPPGHPRLCPYALLLAVHWLERTGTFEDAGDLDRAEQWGRAALALTATGDPTRVAALHALVATLTRQTARHDTAAHAGAAVRMCRKYLAAVPPGQGEHLAVRFSLGTTLKVRHAHTRASRDLDEAVDVLRDAVDDARRAGGPAPDQLRSFAATVYDRYVREHAQEDLDEALGAMKEAVSTAAARGGPAVASALRTELVALERENAAGRGLDATRRPLRRPPTPHQRAKEGRELVDRSQTPEGGLLDLDQGIELLGGALRELPPDFPDRAPYAAYLGQALLNRYEAEQDAADLDAAEETVRHAVRLCPEGDDNQVPFRTLLAMIADVRHQRLGTPETRDAAVQRWRDLLSRPLDLTGYRRRTLHRLGAHLVARHEDTGTLSDLDEGVDALRQALDAAGPADGEHGPVALDLAAALLRRQEHSGTARDLDEAHTCLTDLARVVSSYMPTLRGLLRARRPAAPPDHVRRLLILALGTPPPYASHLTPLPGARQEAEALRRRFPERHTLRLDAAATAQQALHLLDGHTCVHFACHAGQNLADPSKGALYLHDRPLTVTDLTRLDLETPELAVLSGCQTAVGGTDLPDEAIHLAAALLLGNFRHVVSTLWPIGDDSARALTDEVYARLGDPGGRIHPSRTPQALHGAVLEARRRAPDAPLAWASHVHFGP